MRKVLASAINCGNFRPQHFNWIQKSGEDNPRGHWRVDIDS